MAKTERLCLPEVSAIQDYLQSPVVIIRKVECRPDSISIIREEVKKMNVRLSIKESQLKGVLEQLMRIREGVDVTIDIASEEAAQRIGGFGGEDLSQTDAEGEKKEEQETEKAEEEESGSSFFRPAEDQEK